MKIAMMGSGGVGGYYGARLAQSGNQVAFIGRGRRAEAMRKSGLRVRSELGDAHVSPVRVVENPAEAGVQGLVVVAVKLWDSESAAQALGPMIGAQTIAVSLQNGVDNDEVLAQQAGREHVIGGVTHIRAGLAEPRGIAHNRKIAHVTTRQL